MQPQTAASWRKARRLVAALNPLESYPIELIFPIREGRSEQQVGKKGRDKGRWSIGIKFCWLLNEFCRVVAWDWATMNVYAKHFHPIVEPWIGKIIVLADYGFRDQDGVPENMKICKKGSWYERLCVETTLSMVTIVCDLKRIRNRLPKFPFGHLLLRRPLLYSQLLSLIQFMRWQQCALLAALVWTVPDHNSIAG